MININFYCNILLETYKYILINFILIKYSINLKIPE